MHRALASGGHRSPERRRGRTQILWVNPSFLDYRVPVYEELNKLVGNHLWLVYSRDRTPERVSRAITGTLGTRARGLTGERYLRLGRQTTDMANAGVVLPWQPHLLSTVLSVPATVVIAEGFFQWTPAAVIKAVMQRLPLVIAYERTAHTERHCPAWRSTFRKGIMRFAKAILCNGRLSAEYARSLGMPAERIVTGAMAADSDGLRQAARRITPAVRTSIRTRLQCSAPTFLQVGKINGRKGVSHLLHAWETYAVRGGPGTLLIAGDGPERVALQRHAEESHIPRIHWLGEVDYERLPEIYVAADVLVMATLEDNWSLVVPEAMACGLPVACSYYNGCWPELIDEGHNGTVFDPLDEGDFLRALWFFAQRVDALGAMGRRSVEIETTYSPANAARAALRACRVALEGPARAGDNQE